MTMGTDLNVTTKRHKTIECPISRARAYDCFHDGRRTVVEVKCDKCPATHRISCSPGANVSAVAQRLRPDGWMADSEGHNALCPSCLKPKRERAEIPIGKSSAPPPPTEPRPNPRSAPLTSKPLANLDTLVTQAAKPTPPPPALPKPPAPTPKPKSEPDVFVSKTAAKKRPDLAPRTCALEGCTVKFKPDRITQKFHSIECMHQYHGKHRKPRSSTDPMPLSTQANTPEAIRADRLMYQLLDDHYDCDTHLFDDGWNDDRIAKDCNVAPVRVRTCREALYGRPVSAELLKLRHEIASALEQTKKDRATLDAMARDTVADLRNLVKEALDRNHETLKELATRVAREIGSDS